jgi:MinD superfamily P-loop ATPase
MQIAVASGKGGTGKTLVATCLTRHLAVSHPVLIDADVEEPNAGLLLAHQLEKTFPVYRPVPEIDSEACTQCGLCADICRFNALVVLPESVMVFNELCHSCGACEYLCPEKAIKEEKHRIGSIEQSVLNDGGTLISGQLSIGEAQSPPLIKATRDAAGKEAHYTIIDCPPGTTCPMIESIRNSDYCLLVTEPTPFGIHDLDLSIEASATLGIPCGIIINRWQGDDGEIVSIAAKKGIPILGRIPFSFELARSYAQGGNPLDQMPELGEILEQVIAGIEAKVS